VRAGGPGHPVRFTGHPCEIPACPVLVASDRLMCRPHWYQVPKLLRDLVYATWRSGAGVFTPEYREAVRQAVEAVQARGQR
jgi:hypothetical protein